MIEVVVIFTFHSVQVKLGSALGEVVASIIYIPLSSSKTKIFCGINNIRWRFTFHSVQVKLNPILIALVASKRFTFHSVQVKRM